MRKFILFVAVVVITGCFNCINAQTAAGSGQDAKATRNKAIALASFNAYVKGEIDAAYKDFDKEVAYYHSEHPWAHKGLDSMIINAKAGYKTNKVTFPNRETQIVTAAADGDYVMLLFNDSASWTGDMDIWKATGKSYKTTDVLVFKFDEAGKIIEQRFILPFSEVTRQIEDGVESEINNVGYKLIGEKKYNDAIEVFKLNVKLYPAASNAYDSLAEAYSLAGNKKLAIENYEKSVKLDPKNENGKEMIIKLKAK